MALFPFRFEFVAFREYCCYKSLINVSILYSYIISFFLYNLGLLES